MKIAVLLMTLLFPFAMNQVAADFPGESELHPATVTLYSPNKYPNEQKDFCFKFESGVVRARFGGCDLRYGTLWVSNEKDWFETSTAQGARSVIKDLGLHGWNDKLAVPLVEPFPKLKPGEQRRITVDASGADGEDGKPGARGVDGDGVVRSTPDVEPVAPPRRPKHDGKPKVDPIWVKATVGHIYVIHVVDETRDFYALFRVESLQRGDNCTISWKLIPPPERGVPGD